MSSFSTMTLSGISRCESCTNFKSCENRGCCIRRRKPYNIRMRHEAETWNQKPPWHFSGPARSKWCRNWAKRKCYLARVASSPELKLCAAIKFYLIFSTISSHFIKHRDQINLNLLIVISSYSLLSSFPKRSLVFTINTETILIWLRQI